jgi:DNA-binding MarR family transcriptional regulator
MGSAPDMEPQLPLGALLWRASVAHVDRMLAELAALGYADLARAHMKIFPVLEAAGTRITAMAVRLQVSKQAVAKLIDDLERRGYLYRDADARDGRARLVKLTPRGASLLRDAVAVRRRIEEKILAELPPSERDAIHSTLRTLTAALADRETP